MTNQIRRHFIKTSLAALASFSAMSACTAARKRPNILFIMGDDHTTQAISCYKGLFAELAQTTNIDSIAAEGVRLDNCFCTNSICSPSRATILTGTYSHKNGVHILNENFDGSQMTFPQVFQQSGYQTAIYGKWHLKSRPTGFDDYKVLQKQGRYENPQFVVPGTDALEEIQGWSTDVIADLSINFLDNRDSSKPYLLCTHFKATHDPWDSREPYKSMWQDEEFPEPDNLYDDYQNRSQAAHRTTLKLEYMNQGTYPHKRLKNATLMQQRGYIYQQYIKSFIRCGRVLDENVGRILDYLKKKNLLDNTIIIYTADQGHFLGEHGFFSKRFIYEEAMRMPFIIRYPKMFKPGTTNDDMISNVDFAPTLLDCADLHIPEEMQGKSFKKNLQGRTPNDWPDAVYYHYWQHLLHRQVTAHYGIRTKDKKLIFYYGLPLGFTDFEPTEPEWEFFDLEKDPHEMYNAYNDAEYAETIANLKVKLIAYKEKYEDADSKYPELEEVAKKYW